MVMTGFAARDLAEGKQRGHGRRPVVPLERLSRFFALIVENLRFECCRAAATAAMVGHIGAASGRFLKTLVQNFLPDGY